MSITIRPEREADVLAIRELTVAAFQKSELGYHGEAEIIERLRAGCPEILSLVAEENERIVGHILFSPVQIPDEGRTASGMGLAPMCVAPAFQSQGIGSRLVEKGLELLAEKACPFVVVLGHPAFYARFGFEPAIGFGITCEFPGIPEGVFRIKLLSIRPKDLPKGTAKYRGEFSVEESSESEPR
jgi:predicted N-acetyltransferase YhbS